MDEKNKKSNGYLAATLGSVLVGIPFGAAFGYFGALVGITQGSSLVEAISLVPALFAGLGWVIGATVGCYLGLKTRGYASIGATMVWLLLLIPVGWLIILFFGDEGTGVLRALFGIVVIMPPLLARKLALR